MKPFLNLCQHQITACSGDTQEIHKIWGCTARSAVLALKFLVGRNRLESPIQFYPKFPTLHSRSVLLAHLIPTFHVEQFVGKLLKNETKVNTISLEAILISLGGFGSMKTNGGAILAGSVSGTPLIWLRMEGACVFILSLLLYVHMGASWWHFVLLLLVPDVAMAGYWYSARVGAMTYNVAHSYVGPTLLTSAAFGTSHATWLPYCLIWAAHIGMDRGLGYGLKYPDSFKMTHLLRLGHERSA